MRLTRTKLTKGVSPPAPAGSAIAVHITQLHRSGLALAFNHFTTTLIAAIVLRNLIFTGIQRESR